METLDPLEIKGDLVDYGLDPLENTQIFYCSSSYLLMEGDMPLLDTIPMCLPLESAKEYDLLSLNTLWDCSFVDPLVALDPFPMHVRGVLQPCVNGQGPTRDHMISVVEVELLSKGGTKDLKEVPFLDPSISHHAKSAQSPILMNCIFGS
jgi:hypothetical protein